MRKKQNAFYLLRLHREARDEAQAAADAQDAYLPPESERGLDCGFGWVIIKPATAPLAKLLKEAKIGNPARPGWRVSAGDLHNVNTQSISVQEAAVKAYAAVLQRHGIDADWNSRLD